MKEPNTIAGNATIKQHQKEILLNTKEQYMKESNTLASNATIKHHQKEIFFFFNFAPELGGYISDHKYIHLSVKGVLTREPINLI